MKTNFVHILSFWGSFIIICLSLPACNLSSMPETKHLQQQAVYSKFRFRTGDTINFALSEHSYNRIGSISYFQSNGTPYISFYDRGSKSILTYDFHTRQLVNIVPLVKWVKQTKLDKASVMFKNFDTIFVTTLTSVYLFDSSGHEFNKVDFYDATGKKGTVTNAEPPVIKDNYLFMGIKPNVNERSLAAHQRWRGLYKINMQTGAKEMLYPLPPIYHTRLYGHTFLEYSYCINNKGNFVFSFAADSNVYETDLSSFQNSYNAQSRYHKGPIPHMTKEDLTRPDSYAIYALRDSYGAISFNPVKRLYFRQAKQGASQKQVAEQFYGKKKSIIIMDENFQIIGEEEYDEEFSFSSLFFTNDGKSYGRVNPKNEFALQFVEVFLENDKGPLVLKK